MALSPERSVAALTSIAALFAVNACSTDAKTPSVAPSSVDAGGTADAAPEGGTLADRATALVQQMTLEEKLAMMAGRGALQNGFWPSPGVSRLGVPDLVMSDGARGLAAPQFVPGSPVRGTAFPVASARGASFDVALEESVGLAIGEEARAYGGNVILAPVVNLLRHPAWGRAQETYGEDPMHLGAMGAAFVRGAQHHVIANPKHFAANDIEDTRFSVSVNLDERTLREVFLAPFKATIDAGALSVMTAYNKVDGTYCSENTHLISDILFGEWKFTGFVESDWILAVRSTVPSVVAGLDIEMPGANYLKPELIQAGLDSGDVPLEKIDDAATRIVRAELELAARQDPAEPAQDVVGGAAHTALARDVARKSMVLLRNEGNLLPLEKAALSRLAIVGSFANIARLGDDRSSNVVPAHTVTPLDGIAAGAPGLAIDAIPTDTPTAADASTISAASAAVVVVGLTADDEHENTTGTGGDRKTLHLSAAHEALITQVATLNPKTVVVVEAGSAIITTPWVDSVPAILFAWYPGEEGGNALADVLFGDANPSGRLPVTFPSEDADLPPFDRTSTEVAYDYLHGYRFADTNAKTPTFPFGFGLSYTTFSLSNLALSGSSFDAKGEVTATVDVKNDGARDGDEVVELYVSYPGSSVVHGPEELRAFTKVHVSRGGTAKATLVLRSKDLEYWDVGAGAWKLEALKYGIAVGTSSRDLPLHAEISVP
ncbi:MAG TPA: glycoside hydrolase family 3 C-terminal domain-containing protein [Polyangiaceae bacterium]|nr:glycoside hydrolase family 3 C-terminal domain-containing protein [Polyangiaceae bacterium]